MINRLTTLAVIRQLVGKDNIIGIPRIFVEMTDDWSAAALLNQIVYWSGITTDPDGWFYKSAAEWKTEIGLSKHQIERCEKIVAGLGVEIMLRKVGNAPTTHYRVNDEAFLNALEMVIPRFPQTGKSDFPKRGNEISPNGEILLYESEITSEIIFPTPDKSGSVTSPPNPTKPKGASSTRKQPPAKTGRSKQDLDLMYEAIMTTLFEIAPDNKAGRAAQASMVGLFRKSLLEIAPDVTPRRVEQFCTWLASKTDYMRNLKDRAKFQAYYGDFLRDNPVRQWVEGKIVDDVNYRKLRRPPYRKFEGGKFWVKATLLNDSRWEVDPDPILD